MKVTQTQFRSRFPRNSFFENTLHCLIGFKLEHFPEEFIAKVQVDVNTNIWSIFSFEKQDNEPLWKSKWKPFDDLTIYHESILHQILEMMSHSIYTDYKEAKDYQSIRPMLTSAFLDEWCESTMDFC